MNAVSEQFGNFTKQINDGSTQSRITLVILFIILLYVAIRIIFYILSYYYSEQKHITIIKGRLSGKSKTYPTDPDEENGIEIVRSKHGLQFTYTMWLKCFSISSSETIIFTKGSSDGASSCPAIAVTGTNTKHLNFEVRIDEYESATQVLEIKNLPIMKWFNVTIVVNQPHMYVYINGSLKDSYTTETIFKQNLDSIYVDATTIDIADLTYYPSALNGFHIRNIVSKGVDTNAAEKVEDDIFPSYLHNSFYTN